MGSQGSYLQGWFQTTQKSGGQAHLDQEQQHDARVCPKGCPKPWRRRPLQEHDTEAAEQRLVDQDAEDESNKGAPVLPPDTIADHGAMVVKIGHASAGNNVQTSHISAQSKDPRSNGKLCHLSQKVQCFDRSGRVM